MNVGTPIPQYEKAQNIPSGTTYIADMGDGSGTKGITQEVLTKEVGKGLKIGNTEELETDNKESIVKAINEAAKSGGDGSAVDILDSKEEIEANTQSGKVAGALAVQEMFSEINSNLTRMTDNDAIKGLEAREDGVYITYVPAAGADPVSKKLGNLNFNLSTNVRIYYSDNGIRAYLSATINYTYKNGSLSHTVSSNNECSISKTITIS